ncbi:MAG: hypothetical protein EP338_05150 [Bacteroidetes bacterium]|nr:MAG: hypothetical protein EP338_05150 [Bacteroidota bacterium]
MFPQAGAGKKKGLTEATELIPFTGQSLRKSKSGNGTITKKTEVDQSQHERYSLTNKVIPKTVSSVVGNLQTGNFSIKQSLTQAKQKQDEIPVDYSNRPATSFNQDQLIMVWKQLAFRMKDEGLETMYLALSKRDPKLLDQHIIAQELDNQIQVDMLQNKLSDMLEFVREKLNNWSVTIQFSVIADSDEDKKLLTGKDRFEELARKNSNLYSLQRTFNLDVDY